MRVDPTQLAAKAGEIILTLSKEGDRGCVLVAAVLLEQAIESSQSFTLFFSLLVAQIELTIPHIHAIEARYH